MKHFLPANTFKETRVIWRGSTSDLSTDLDSVLSDEELVKLIKELTLKVSFRQNKDKI